jgi:hypothetical protein
VAFEGLTEEWRLVGVMHLEGRLSDVLNRREPIARLTREELEQTALAAEPDFASLWSDVEGLLLSYSDQRYISEDYDREMALAQSRADDSDQITDDPPERIVSWLRTVSDQSIRALDIQLLADLLLVVADGEKREELLGLVVSQIEELVTLGDFDAAHRLAESMVADADRRDELLRLVVSQIEELAGLGDFDAAHRLAESMAALANRPDAPDAAAQVARAIHELVGGTLMSQAAVHLNSVRDEEFEQVKKLCAAIGPALVPRLADTLSAETRNRSRQRLTDLLIAFGAHGRDSADKLKASPNPSVRRTAVQLLRAFGGPEALADLEQLVNDPEPAVQRDAARAIVGFGLDASFEMLKRILETEKHRGRAAVVEELGSTRDQKAAPLICYLVRNLEPRGALRRVYMDAIGRLGVLGGTDAVAALVEVLRRGWWWAPFRTREIRTEAANALAQMRFPAAQEALADAAANGPFGVRAVARKFVRAT